MDYLGAMGLPAEWGGPSFLEPRGLPLGEWDGSTFQELMGLPGMTGGASMLGGLSAPGFLPADGEDSLFNGLLPGSAVSPMGGEGYSYPAFSSYFLGNMGDEEISDGDEDLP